MKKVNRAKLRGRPLDSDCKRANRSIGEYGSDDRRVFCYGYTDCETEETLTKCKECGAFVYNAKPLEDFMKEIGYEESVYRCQVIRENKSENINTKPVAVANK